jgi:hypothetical protein
MACTDVTTASGGQGEKGRTNEGGAGLPGSSPFLVSKCCLSPFHIVHMWESPASNDRRNHSPRGPCVLTHARPTPIPPPPHDAMSTDWGGLSPRPPPPQPAPPPPPTPYADPVVASADPVVASAPAAPSPAGAAAASWVSNAPASAFWASHHACRSAPSRDPVSLAGFSCERAQQTQADTQHTRGCIQTHRRDHTARHAHRPTGTTTLAREEGGEGGRWRQRGKGESAWAGGGGAKPTTSHLPSLARNTRAKEGARAGLAHLAVPGVPQPVHLAHTLRQGKRMRVLCTGGDGRSGWGRVAASSGAPRGKTRDTPGHQPPQGGCNTYRHVLWWALFKQAALLCSARRFLQRLLVAGPLAVLEDVRAVAAALGAQPWPTCSTTPSMRM